MIRSLLSTATAMALVVLTGCSGASTSDSATTASESVQSQEDTLMEIDPNRLEIHGHRGARGLVPENSMPGFVLALREGADVLEMDMCISSDGQIIISHEPWMNGQICLDPNNAPISESQAKTWNLHNMTAEEIAAFDCGSVALPDFPDQQNLPTYKPTLDQVVELAETVPLLDGAQIRYNLEIKHSAELEPEFCPDAATFAKLVLDKVSALGIADRVCIQSFSAAALEAVHQIDPDITTSWLVGTEGTVQSQLDKLTFSPDIYSPQWKLIDANDVAQLQGQDIRVIPWTANTKEDLFALIEMGVNGIITDRPDILYKMR